jgi:hypothetical protein
VTIILTQGGAVEPAGLASLTFDDNNFTGKTRCVCGLARLDLRKNNWNPEKDEKFQI